MSVRVLLLSSLVILAALSSAAWYGFRAAGKPAPGNDVDPTTRVPTTSEAVSLDQEQRAYIWNIEHHVLVLSKHWFHDMSDALSQSDSKAVTAMLDQGFQGGVPHQPEEEKLRTTFARVTRLKDTGNSPLPVDRDGFVSYLMSVRDRFVGKPHVKIFARTLVPNVREDLDSEWRGTGVMRVWGEIAPGKPGETVVHFQFRMPRPLEEPRPGWLRQARVTQSQVSDAESFLLQNVTRERGINPDLFRDNWKEEKKLNATGGIYLCDYNRDGRLDLLVLDLLGIHLFQGQAGGRFKEVTEEVGLPVALPPEKTGLFAAFADLDGDGWEDLIMLGRVYRNDGGRSFHDVTSLSNLTFDAYAGGFVLSDFDRDGKVDLYVTVPGLQKTESWLDGKSGRESGNQLWRNLGNWRFENVTAKSHTDGNRRSVFSAVWLDANDDGWPDLYVPNEFGHGVLLVNRGDGTFREQVIGKLPGDFGSMGLTCGDVNNDGKVDLYLANMYSKTGIRIVGNVKPDSYAPEIMAKMRQFVAGSQLYLNRGDLNFEPVSQAWQMNDVGWAYGPALIDLDNDGFLDVFATSGYMSVDRAEPDG